AQRRKAATLAVPATDTIKWAEKKVVQRTLDRSHIWQIQTPQAFSKPLLKEAFKKAREDDFLGNEEGELVEKLGAAVEIAEGSYENIKITTEADLIFAEAILHHRSKKHEGMEKE